MKPNLVRIRKSRVFSEDLKRKIVKEFESGEFSALQLSRLHQVHFQTIYKWIYKYSSINEKSIRIVEMKESSSQKLKDLEAKVEDLERSVGQKQIYIDYLEKMMEIAKDDLGIDVKKNYSTQLSAGLEKTKKR